MLSPGFSRVSSTKKIVNDPGGSDVQPALSTTGLACGGLLFRGAEPPRAPPASFECVAVLRVNVTGIEGTVRGLDDNVKGIGRGGVGIDFGSTLLL